MRRLARSRVMQLDRRMNLDRPPINRLFFLIPDLWPAERQEVFHHPADLDELSALVERRTGVPPTFGTNDIWAIIVPASEDMMAMDAVEKAAFLEQHETRTLALWQRRKP